MSFVKIAIIYWFIIFISLILLIMIMCWNIPVAYVFIPIFVVFVDIIWLLTRKTY